MLCSCYTTHKFYKNLSLFVHQRYSGKCTQKYVVNIKYEYLINMYDLINIVILKLTK